MSDDETSNVETFLQFNGPVDISKNQYREFRVKQNDLVSILPGEHVVNSISEELKHVTDKHNQRISDLKKQIRELEKLNSLWNSLKKISTNDGKRLLARILQSNEKTIEQFEVDNFLNDQSWTRTKKAESGVDLKMVLSTINILDSNGTIIGSYQEPVIPNNQHHPVDTSGETSQVNCSTSSGGNIESEKPDRIPQLDPLETSTETIEMKNEVKEADIPKAMESETVSIENSSQPQIEKELDKKPDPIMDYVKENGEEYEREHMEREKEKEKFEKLLNSRKEVETASSSKQNGDISNQTNSNGQKLTEKLNEYYEKTVQVQDDTDNLSIREKEERRKLAVAQKIAELKCFIDAELKTIIYDTNHIKSLVRTVVGGRDPTRLDKKPENIRNNFSKTALDQIDEEEEEEGEKEGAVEEKEKEADVSFENAQSESSFETATTSTTLESESTSTDLSVKNSSTNNNRKAPGANKKKAKKGKKQKKNKNAPKITMEEVEAIKKMKKEEADKAFKLRDEENKARLAKIEASERHKMYRKAAETALEMEATDGIDLPIIIEQLNSNLEFHVNITTDYERIRLRELYFKERVKEVTASFVGSVLACKMQCLMTFRNHIHRSLHLFKYIMFLVSLDETDDEFYEFECMTLEYFCRGYEEHVEPTETSTPLQLAFYYFNMDVVSGIPETDQFINAVTMVRNKLILLEDMSEMLPLTDDEKTMRDTYFAMAQFLKEYRHVTNVTSFLQVNKGEAKFDLMEEWFFASKKPTQHLSVPTPESC